MGVDRATKGWGWTSARNRSLFVLMHEPLYTLLPLIPGTEPPAAGLTLEEAFTRIMALCERHYTFARVGRVMRLYVSDAAVGEPEFESDVPIDAYARRAIKAQVCEHGLGRYRILCEAQRATMETCHG
jgi:hypothetical protein